MDIALIGYGKMGQLVEQMALARGHRIVARFSRQLGIPQNRSSDLTQADLVIDFSHAFDVIDHLKLCLSLNKPIVIGTTGWETQLPIAQELVQTANGSCLYAPNFSIGVYLFQKIVAYTGSLFQAFGEY